MLTKRAAIYGLTDSPGPPRVEIISKNLNSKSDRLLAGAAVGAGVINAVAGGGTLLTFPTLLAFGVAPVATYGGYFGAGIGILTLAMLAFIGMRNIYEMNALKTVLGSLINLMAALWFIAAGLIDWPRCAVMTIGAVAGYYVGSHFSQRISQARVRQIIAVIGFTISAVTFYQEFLRPG